MVGGDASMTGERKHIMADRSLDCILMLEDLKVVQGKHYVICVAYMGLLSLESDLLFSLKSPSVPKTMKSGRS